MIAKRHAQYGQTNLRRMEAASLRWSDIDLKASTFTVQDTKNREVHTLPMTNFLSDKKTNATYFRFFTEADAH